MEKRRHTLRPVGLEVMIKIPVSYASSSAAMGFYDDAESLFLSFSTMRQRDELFDALMRSRIVQENVRHDDPDDVRRRWQKKEISNYEYIMYLNMLAHRSFNDITQYPVFPWVIASYDDDELGTNDTMRAKVVARRAKEFTEHAY